MVANPFYVYEEYPKWLHFTGKPSLLAHDKEEEDEILKKEGAGISADKCKIFDENDLPIKKRRGRPARNPDLI